MALIAIDRDWRSREACVAVEHEMSRHLVGLRAVFRHSKGAIQPFYTGFCFAHGEYFLWVTAGHCLRELRAIRNDRSLTFLSASLVDNFPKNDADCVPLDESMLDGWAIDTDGVDLGFLSLRSAIALPLLAEGTRLRVVNTAMVQSPLAAPDGHYLLGFPNDWIEREDRQITAHRRQAVLCPTPACFPVDLVVDQGASGEAAGGFWGHGERAIYGRVSVHSDNNGRMPQNLKGMSGGLLIAFKNLGKGTLKYQVVGVQSACAESDPSLILATRLSVLPPLVDAVIQKSTVHRT